MTSSSHKKFKFIGKRERLNEFIILGSCVEGLES